MQRQPDPAAPLPAASQREFVHKLNNLLTVVLSHAENSLTSDDAAEMKCALQIIAKTSNAMAEVVRAFAKSSAQANSIARGVPRSDISER